MTEKNYNYNDEGEKVDVQEYQLKDGDKLFDESAENDSVEYATEGEGGGGDSAGEEVYQPVQGSKHDKAKQVVALFGGFLSALLLFLQSLGLDIAWFNEETIGAFTNFLMAAIPLGFVGYGLWKNTFIVTKKAREQEEVLKEKGLK